MNSYSPTNTYYILYFSSKGIAKNMNVVTSTCPITKKKTTIHIASKIKVNGMKGDSELTIMPNYLSKEVCHSLATTIRTSDLLRQYFRKRKKSDDMQPGWKEPRLMLLCHEDASSFDLSGRSPGYGYRDVRISGIPYDAIPELQEVAEQFAKGCGVPCWDLGVNIVFLTNDQGKVGWHSYQQGEKYIGCIILEITEEPRPVNIKQKVKKGIEVNFANHSLKLGMGSYYGMNGAMGRFFS